MTFWNGFKINQHDADKIKLKNLQKLLRKVCTSLYACGIIQSRLRNEPKPNKISSLGGQ